jgi:VCBS repeat-containing protein
MVTRVPCRRRSALTVESLEQRLLLTGNLTIPLDPDIDQFGDQILTVQAYETDSLTVFGIFDTGASALTFGAEDLSFLPDQIPVKVPGGASAEGIGGSITGDVSQPGTILADGFHAADLSFDPDGFPLLNINFGPTSAATPGIQAFLGTEDGSPILPSITGTPILNESPAHPNGLAALVDMQGAKLDFSDIIPDLILPLPDIQFVEPGTVLTPTPDTTDVVQVPVTLFGGDNHTNPGDLITESPSPLVPGIQLVQGPVSLDHQTFLFDTGAQLSIISTAEAEALGLDLSNPETTIEVQGAAGTAEVPGYTLDHLVVSQTDGSVIDFTTVPVYVLDIGDGIDGILGMNLMNWASRFLYDPHAPGGPALSFTFFTSRDTGDGGDGSLGLILQHFGGAFGGALGSSLQGHNLPDFAPPTSPPHATNDAFVTAEDTPLTVAGPGVLGNDTDPNRLPLTAALVSGPAHGTLALSPNGSFTYTPAGNYNGPDAFTYKASDGRHDSNVATVTLTVSAVNDPPVAANDAATTAEDTPLAVAAPGVLGNDTDVESPTLTAVLVSGPAHGTVTLNADGSFTYTPAANYNGLDAFTYKANDGQADSNVATVSLAVTAVNDPPVAANDTASTLEDTPLTVAAPGVLANDTDVDSPSLTAVLVSAPAHGTLTLNADGSFTYTPDANYNGPDSFAYKANDGQADSNVATVSLTVTAVNDAPVAANDTATTPEDTALTVAAPGVLSNDTDVDSPTLTAVLVRDPTHGSLTLNADGSFTYTPAPDYNGPDSFTYKASDGRLDSNVATVSLTVTAVNDAPVAANDAASMAEDTALTVAAPGVLSNDTDVDSPTLSAVLVSSPAHGTLTLNPDGSFTYTPNANYNGPDSFTYKANDGSLDSNVATMALTVTAVDDAPVAGNDAASTAEETALTVAAPGVLSNDTDVDSPTLSAVLVSSPAHGTLILNADGSFTYSPAANYSGADAFTYRASDGTLTSGVATVALTVTAVDDAPVAADDAATTAEDTPLTVAAPGVLGNDTDVDSPTLTAVLVSRPAHGSLTLNADGSFTYTPAAAYSGPDSFTYKASDGTLTSAVATVSLTVTPAPVVTGQLTGLIFHDGNGNVSPDAGEAGLAGWTVFLDTNANGKADPGEPTTTTDAGGVYRFPNLTPGTYRAGVVVPTGWGATVAPIDVTVGAGQTAGQDLGFATLAERFVFQVYRDVLGRAVDPGGLASWTGALSGGATYPQVSQAIEHSHESLVKQVSDQYFALLGRDADAQGLAHFVGLLEQGGTVSQVRARILGSPEFLARAGGTDAAFLASFYQAVLGRAVDPSGARTWGTVLAGGTSRAAVAAAVLGSPEGLRVQVESFYQRFLHRGSDPDGLSTFTGALQRGVPEDAVVAAIVSSDEYLGRL